MNDEMQRGQFTFYRSYYEAVKELPKRDQTTVLLAVCAYALDGEVPKLSGTSSAIFTLIRPTLDAARRKAEGAKNGRAGKDSDKIAEGCAGDSAKEKEGEKEDKKEIENKTEIEIEKENKNKTERKKEKKTDTKTEDDRLAAHASSIGQADAFSLFAGGDTKLLDTLRGFEEMRKSMKKPLFGKAKELLVQKLNELSHDRDQQIAILEQSIMNSWQGLFPLSHEQKESGNPFADIAMELEELQRNGATDEELFLAL